MALMVIEVLTLSSGMPSNSVSISRLESIATPTLPTSPQPWGGPSHSRSESAGRKRHSSRSVLDSEDIDSAGWTPPRCRNRHTGAWSNDAHDTSTAAHHA